MGCVLNHLHVSTMKHYSCCGEKWSYEFSAQMSISVCVSLQKPQFSKTSGYPYWPLVPDLGPIQTSVFEVGKSTEGILLSVFQTRKELQKYLNLVRLQVASTGN